MSMAMTATVTAARVQRSWAEIVKGETAASREASPDACAAVAPLQLEVPMPDHATESESPAVPGASPVTRTVLACPEPQDQLASGTCKPSTSEEPPPDAHTHYPLQPGARGSLECLCRGTVLSMLSHYGWVAAFSDIDHPLVMKHFGRIYLHKRDIVDGQSLKVGDVVSFYLYADTVGLGAEVCKLEGPAPGSERTSLRADAMGFVPERTSLRADAMEFVPGGSRLSEQPDGGLTLPASSQGPRGGAVSDMFARMSRAFESIPANGYVQMAGINSAYFDSDDSSEDGDLDADADKESVHDESDLSSAECAAPAPFKLAALASHAPWVLRRAKSPDPSMGAGMTSDSTSAGRTSDSETDCPSPPETLRIPPSVDLSSFRPPPGLCPPPGLEAFLPSLVA